MDFGGYGSLGAKRLIEEIVTVHSVPPRGVFTHSLRDKPEDAVREIADFAISVHQLL